MKRTGLAWILAAGIAVSLGLQSSSQTRAASEDEIAIHRNLGKAFYENPTTHQQAVEEFQKALELAPDSPRERINYGLALLRAGKTSEGIAELQKAQQQDPAIPHTWFSLGIAFKKEGEFEKAIEQFRQMVQRVPDEPISHYNLGYLYRLTDRLELAGQQFETAARLAPDLAGPHFQLYNAYRQAGRTQDAERELNRFQEIRKRNGGAAIPEDLDWSYYAEVYETIEPLAARDAAPLNTELRFADTSLGSGFDPRTAGLVVLDFNGDGRADLLAWSASGARIFRDGTTLVPDAGLAGLQGIRSIAPGDFNNDGLPDLCVVTESGALLYVNRRGRFRKSPAQLPAGRYAKAVWLDYDHDYDLDLILLGERQALVRNNGSAGFSDLTSEFPFVAGRATDAVVFDRMAFDNGMDLLVSYADRGAVLYRDRLAGRYEAVPLDVLPQGAMHLVARDWNNDGWTDLAASYGNKVSLLRSREGRLEVLSELDSAGGPLAFADLENRGFADLVAGGGVFRNQGLGRFVAAKPVAPESPAVALAEADFNRDGKLDLAAILSDGSLHLLRNESATSHSWLQVALTGVKNLLLAPGARVEVKAGRLYQKQTYAGVPLHFGVLSHAQVDAVRITWPNGFVQNEAKQAPGRAVAYKEMPRFSGSCPTIFTWDGRDFALVADALAFAPVGATAGEGRYLPVNHGEYIRIPGNSVALAEGRYEIRITEELREVSYVDEVRLVAVDHPSDAELFPNDKFKAPPFPEFRLFGVRRRIYPQAARDQQGRDVLARLLRRDASYPDGFQCSPGGIAELHSLDLDFGGAAVANRAVLFLDGWIYWSDSSTRLAASQERRNVLVPYLQVKDAAGQWQTVLQDMGMPTGQPRTIAVDLTGKFLSSSREVRIVTNRCVYWDEIFLSEETSSPEIAMTAMHSEQAALRFHGFSQLRISAGGKQPEQFDYSRPMLASAWNWNPVPGWYTRYGDVRPLLDSTDDRVVIMGPGDELRLLFDAARLPALRPGWQRDFLLFVDGWVKDADPYTAHSQSVEPLPFHGMSQYPYPPSEHFPDDELHRRYREQYNTRPALRLVRPLTETAQGARTRP